MTGFTLARAEVTDLFFVQTAPAEILLSYAMTGEREYAVVALLEG